MDITVHFYCALGVSPCSRVGKVYNEHDTFLYPTLDRGKWSVTRSTTSSYEKKIVSSHQMSPRNNLERVMTNRKVTNIQATTPIASIQAPDFLVRVLGLTPSRNAGFTNLSLCLSSVLPGKCLYGILTGL